MPEADPKDPAFTELLSSLRKGSFLHDARTAVAEVEEAVMELGKPGTVTITLTLRRAAAVCLCGHREDDHDVAGEECLVYVSVEIGDGVAWPKCPCRRFRDAVEAGQGALL